MRPHDKNAYDAGARFNGFTKDSVENYFRQPQ
jgi:hypothetical protein